MANFAVGNVAVPVFVPNPSAHSPSVTIYNSGPSVIYLGGSDVTSATGLPLYVNAEVAFPNAPSTLYAIGAVSTTGTGTTLASNAAAGGTTVALTSSGNYSVGEVLVVGASGAAETVTVSTLTGGTGISITSPTRLDHVNGGTVALVLTSQSTNLSVTALSV